MAPTSRTSWADGDPPPPATTAIRPLPLLGRRRRRRSAPSHLRNRSSAAAPPASSAPPPRGARGLLGRSTSGGRDVPPPRRWDREPNPFGNEEEEELSEPEAFDEHQNMGINYAYEDISVVTSGREVPPAIGTFAEIDLGVLNENIRRCKYVRPTPMQRHAIPISLAGRDLMACAQTGSGKTAAICLAIISGIMRCPRMQRPQPSGTRTACPLALILSPTRELCMQIYEEANKFSYQTGISVVLAYGGLPITQQLRDLERGVDILVATPGRLVDLLGKKRVSLQSIRYLALDEADGMLDMGFERHVRRIVEQMDMPPRGVRQTLLFSATFPGEIQRMASDFLENYIFLAVRRVGSSTELIAQRFEFVQEADKRSHLMDLHHAQRESSDRPKELYGQKGLKNLEGKAVKSNPNADFDLSIGLSRRYPWCCSLCRIDVNCEKSLLQHANGRNHREAAIAYHASQQNNGKAANVVKRKRDNSILLEDSDNDVKSQASQSVVHVRSFKPVTLGPYKHTSYKSCHGIIVDSSPNTVYIAVHQEHINPKDEDIILVCFHDRKIKTAQTFVKETDMFRILQVEVSNHRYHSVRPSDVRIDRQDVFLFWNYGQNHLVLRSSSIVNTSTAAVNLYTGLKSLDDSFTFGCKDDIEYLKGAPVFTLDGLFVGAVCHNHHTIQTMEDETGRDVIYARHAINFIPMLLKNIKDKVLSNNAQGKPDKPKPNADVDISAGLSTNPPWVCRLCNRTTASKEVLLWHANGRKHRAKAKAYHDARNQGEEFEQTSHGKEIGEPPNLYDEKGANSEREVDKNDLKRKRTSGKALEEPDIAKKPKIKWKKIVTNILETNPDKAMRLKKLQKLVSFELQKCGLFHDKEQLHALLSEKIASSSRFSVDGNNIRLASKNKENKRFVKNSAVCHNCCQGWPWSSPVDDQVVCW